MFNIFQGLSLADSGRSTSCWPSKHRPPLHGKQLMLQPTGHTSQALAGTSSPRKLSSRWGTTASRRFTCLSRRTNSNHGHGRPRLNIPELTTARQANNSTHGTGGTNQRVGHATGNPPQTHQAATDRRRLSTSRDAQTTMEPPQPQPADGAEQPMVTTPHRPRQNHTATNGCANTTDQVQI